jgi:hypothetical protein
MVTATVGKAAKNLLSRRFLGLKPAGSGFGWPAPARPQRCIRYDSLYTVLYELLFRRKFWAATRAIPVHHTTVAFTVRALSILVAFTIIGSHDSTQPSLQEETSTLTACHTT